jgi:hypothetical protein
VSVEDAKNGRLGGQTERLKTLEHVRHGLADVIRKAKDGRMEPEAARNLAYCYKVLAGVIKDKYQVVELQKALADMQAQLDAMRARPRAA